MKQFNILFIILLSAHSSIAQSNYTVGDIASLQRGIAARAITAVKLPEQDLPFFLTTLLLCFLMIICSFVVLLLLQYIFFLVYSRYQAKRHIASNINPVHDLPCQSREGPPSEPLLICDETKQIFVE